MIVLKAIIQTSFTSINHTSFNTPRLSTTNTKHSTNLFLCKSTESDSEPSPPKGDTRKQELLARIAQLQAQKVRLTDFLDERSEYLTQFAEEANSEFDKIGDDALKGLDEASDRVCIKTFTTTILVWITLVNSFPISLTFFFCNSGSSTGSVLVSNYPCHA